MTKAEGRGGNAGALPGRRTETSIVVEDIASSYHLAHIQAEFDLRALDPTSFQISVAGVLALEKLVLKDPDECIRSTALIQQYDTVDFDHHNVPNDNKGIYACFPSSSTGCIHMLKSQSPLASKS
jgi:hypothetical protein